MDRPKIRISAPGVRPKRRRRPSPVVPILLSGGVLMALVVVVVLVLRGPGGGMGSGSGATTQSLDDALDRIRQLERDREEVSSRYGENYQELANHRANLESGTELHRKINDAMQQTLENMQSDLDDINAQIDRQRRLVESLR